MTKNEERKSWVEALEGAPLSASRSCPDGLVGLHNPETGNSICQECARRILERGPTLLGSKLQPVWSDSNFVILCVTCGGGHR